MQSPLAVAALKQIADARFGREEGGQDLLEYAVLVALIALVAIISVGALGTAISDVFWENIASTVAGV